MTQLDATDFRFDAHTHVLSLAAVMSLAGVSCVPLWATATLPLQDLAQHEAMTRILVDWADPELNFAETYRLQPLRTQYWGYYALSALVALWVDVETASRVVWTFILMATPMSLWLWLAWGLRRPGWLALAAVPLGWSSMTLMGFGSFALALPLLLVGLALSERLRATWRWPLATTLGLVGLLTFMTHVLPALVLVALAAWRLRGGSWWETLRREAILLPALLLYGMWSSSTAAGRDAAGALGQATRQRIAGASPSWFAAELRHAQHCFLGMYAGDWDQLVALAWLVLGLALTSLPWWWTRLGTQAPTLSRPLRWQWVPAAAVLLGFFVAPSGIAWVWPIRERFPLLAALLWVAAWPLPLGRVGLGAFAAVTVALTVAMTAGVTQQFARLNRDEVGLMDAAINAVPKGAKVATLVFDDRSQYLQTRPFLQVAGKVQARRGGAVAFSFVGFPMSPVVFRREVHAPVFPPRWEYKARWVQPTRELAWFDYVVVRGGPGRIARERAYRCVFRSRRWSVWYRRRGE